MALGKVRRRPSEERQRLAQAIDRPFDAEHPNARGGQLDRERQPVERARYPYDREGVLTRQLEVGRDLGSPFDVEANGR